MTTGPAVATMALSGERDLPCGCPGKPTGCRSYCSWSPAPRQDWRHQAWSRPHRRARRGGRGEAPRGRRARLQRLQPDPATGQAGDDVRRPPLPTAGGSRTTGTTSATTSRRSGSCPAGPARAATSPWSSGCRRTRRAAHGQQPGHDVTHWFELSIAPWISIERVRPELRSAAAVHAAVGRETRRTAATRAAARPSWSCSSTRPGSPRSPTPSAATTRTGARRSTIDSLECTGNGFVGPCNNNCVEPVNFAFIQTNGVPTGPPARSSATWRRSRPTRTRC